MAFTYDSTLPTNKDKVRLKIRDTDTVDATRQLFQDTEIDFFISEAGSDLNLAAAGALDSIAANAALLAKAQKIGDYSIDSKSMAGAVMKIAAHYRSLSEQAPAFGYAEQTLSGFSYWDIVINELLREG